MVFLESRVCGRTHSWVLSDTDGFFHLGLMVVFRRESLKPGRKRAVLQMTGGVPMSRSVIKSAK